MQTGSGQVADAVVRLIHCSDIHVARPGQWRTRDWMSKRVTGWLNQRFGRGRRFRQTGPILAAFAGSLRAKPPDALVFSGDASALSWETEFAGAADLLGVAGGLPCAGIAVPGNHDYYTRDAAASGLFERHFAPWQVGERVDGAVYPFARRVGHVWLIGVNSCTGNRWPHDASGAVGRAQLDRLERLLASLSPGPRILVTHYPVALADGRPETSWHGLRDLEDVLATAARGKISLWLHGHRHHSFHLPSARGTGIPVFCAGSLTQDGCASYWEYAIHDRNVRAMRHTYAPLAACFHQEAPVQFVLP